MTDIHQGVFERFQKGVDRGASVQELRPGLQEHLASCPDCSLDIDLHQRLRAEAALRWPATLQPRRPVGETLSAMSAELDRMKRRQGIFIPLRAAAWIALVILIMLAANWVFANLRPEPAATQAPAGVEESAPSRWTLLTAPDARPEDYFGYTAAIDGDFLVAGAPGLGLLFPEEGGEAAEGSVAEDEPPGSVYVFQRQGGEWSEGLKLSAGDAEPGDRFGLRVAISGDTLAVGAPYKWVSPGGNAAGAVYVFQHRGGTWSQQARLAAPDGAPFDLFGSSLALQGDTLAVGTRSADLPGAPNAGAVYVFQRQGAEWSLQAMLAAGDARGRDYFGHALALFEDTLLVAAPGHDERAGGDDNPGAVYHFRRSDDAWRQEARLDPPGLAPNAQFGSALALDARTGLLVVLAQEDRPNPDPGPDVGSYLPEQNYLPTAYVFERRGADWHYQARLSPDYRPDIYLIFRSEGRVAAGRSASSGETVALSMGFFGNYIFQRQGDRWAELSEPDILYQSMGEHTLSNLLAADEGLLIFGSTGLSEPGFGVLLVELD